jgi:uncharacterized RDD family membrane protein YckC
MTAISESPLSIPVSAVGMKFSKRAWAYIIDWLTVSALTYLSAFFVSMVYSLFYIIIAGTSPNFEISKTLDYLISFVMSIVYFSVFEWLYGASLGKLILRMHVVMTDGSPCTLKAAIIRGLLRLVDGLFFGLIAYSKMKPPYYKRIGDNSANTMVVDARNPLIQQKPGWWRFLIALVIYEVILSGNIFLQLLLGTK